MSKWQAGEKYRSNDLVVFNKKVFRCIQYHIAINPWTPELASPFWKLVA